MTTRRRPRRPHREPMPLDWRERHQLPSLATLEQLSRVDSDEDSDEDEPVEQMEFDLSAPPGGVLSQGA